MNRFASPFLRRVPEIVHVSRARFAWLIITNTCWPSVLVRFKFTNTKKLARIEASSICCQQFANLFADCFCAFHTYQLEFAVTSLPCKGRFKDVRANCFCASLLRSTAHANSHATSCIERAGQVLKWTMIGQKAIAIVLLGFNDLGRSVTPTFLFRNRFYLQLSPHCSKMNKKSMWEVKKISRFLSTGHGFLPSCGCKARETMVSKCELILWGTSPVD